MERLTVPDVRVDEHTTRRSVIDVLAVREHAMEIYHRLKAYEDIAELCGGLDRLRELAEADKDGRCVVLPCKVGEHIFVTGTLKIVECKVDAIYKDERNPVVCVTFDCDSDCYGCPFYDPLPDPEGDFRCKGELHEAEISFDVFGKTVFMTREEAERAMEGRKEADNA